MEHSSSEPHVTPEPSTELEPREGGGFWGETLRFSLIALLIVLPIRFFVAQPFIVSGASMEHTFSTGQYLIVDQVSYRFEAPARGDVIVFKYPRDPSKYFIKRVIGLPGDTVTISGGTVTISNDEHPEGTVLDEPYLPEAQTNGSKIQTTLADGEYFVMGDNRNASSDSRSWGTLPEENIIGRAILRLFPISNFDLFPGEFNIGQLLDK